MKYHRFSIFLFVFFLFISISLIGQNPREIQKINYPLSLPKYCDLSSNIEEASGLMVLNNYLWTFNDSGGDPEIYKIDNQTGKIIQTVRIINGENKDWEDITNDDKYIYVGDFGNNRGNRKDLKIYKLEINTIGNSKKEQIAAEIISFAYKDQHSFEINNRGHNFDCESLISYNDSLIIFSKNWENGRTKMYKLPKNPGNYLISPIENFKSDGLVTGADYSLEKNELLLVGYKNHIPFIYSFSDFNGHGLQDSGVFRVNFIALKEAQTEGIAWINNDSFLISTEKRKDFDQQVFIFQLSKISNYLK